jgi:hypothetical protein
LFECSPRNDNTNKARREGDKRVPLSPGFFFYEVGVRFIEPDKDGSDKSDPYKNSKYNVGQASRLSTKV